MSALTERLLEVVPLGENIAAETTEEGQHAMRAFLSLIGLTGLLNGEDFTRVMRAMHIIVYAMGDPEDWLGDDED